MSKHNHAAPETFDLIIKNYAETHLCLLNQIKYLRKVVTNKICKPNNVYPGGNLLS